MHFFVLLLLNFFFVFANQSRNDLISVLFHDQFLALISHFFSNLGSTLDESVKGLSDGFTWNLHKL